MRIVLTVPEDILREACQRIVVFCQDNIGSRENLKEFDGDEITVSKKTPVICDD